MNFPARMQFLVAAICLSPQTSNALEVVTAPDDFVFVHAANSGRGYADLMIGTIALHNESAASEKIKSLAIDIEGADEKRLSKSVPVTRIIAQTSQLAGMAAQGGEFFLNAQLLNGRGLKDSFGEDAALASSALLASGEVAITTAHYFAVDFTPDRVVITATYEDASGSTRTAQRVLAARTRDQVIEYDAPLKGAWLERSFPSVHSHHRFIPSNEFAFDFFMPGPEGELDRGDETTGADDYGYGEPIFAVADGKVFSVIDGETQDLSALSRHDGESLDDARARITAYQIKRFSENFRAAAAGNMIVLEHGKNGAKEYSSYGHLKPGSITVKTGQYVKRGEKIGEVGNTGDSTLTHLHFQLNAGPDPFFSRSLPIAFSNAKSQFVGQEPGIFVVLGD